MATKLGHRASGKSKPNQRGDGVGVRLIDGVGFAIGLALGDTPGLAVAPKAAFALGAGVTLGMFVPARARLSRISRIRSFTSFISFSYLPTEASGGGFGIEVVGPLAPLGAFSFSFSVWPKTKIAKENEAAALLINIMRFTSSFVVPDRAKFKQSRVERCRAKN